MKLKFSLYLTSLFILFITNSCKEKNVDQIANPINSVKKNKPMKKDNSKKGKLTSLQYKVAYENGTEPPFNNEYWDNKKEGIYVDIVSKKPLFASLDKYKSGTGWPSFTKPIDNLEIVEISDFTHGMSRVEVRSKTANIHLGHLFKDGPKPFGLRYCINSASLQFIAKDEMAEKGYQNLLKIFN